MCVSNMGFQFQSESYSEDHELAQVKHLYVGPAIIRVPSVCPPETTQLGLFVSSCRGV